MRNRSGLTMLEVLVAIFVTAIGLISLMALFPAGASMMQKANTSSRVGYVGVNAMATGVAQNITADPNVLSFLDIDPAVPSTYPHVLPPGSVVVPPDSGSLPVFVDPQGTLNGLPATMAALQSPQYYGIIRVAPSYAPLVGPPQTQTARVQRWFTLMDTVGFNEDGDAKEVASSSLQFLGKPIVDRNIDRSTKYSWAYLLRRPNRLLRTGVEMSVVVYEGRPQVNGQSQEVAYQKVGFDVTSDLIYLTPTGPGTTKPKVGPGSWILDATMIRTTPAGSYYEPHGFFYQVVDVTDDPIVASPNRIRIQLKNRPRMDTVQRNTAGTVVAGSEHGVVIVCEGVSEVLERGFIP